MATKNLKNNETSSKGKNFFSFCGRVLKTVLQMMIIAIVSVFLFIFIFNPVCFMLWASFFPASTAAAVNDWNNVYGDFLRGYCRPMTSILPFYAKKHFMVIYGIDNYSVRLQLRFYKQAEDKVETVKMMSREAVEKLWVTGRNYIYIVSAGAVLTDEMFKELIEESITWARFYVEKTTPSAKKIEIMLTYLEHGPVIRETADLVVYTIKKHGLPTQLALKALSLEEHAEKIRQALRVYSQNQIRMWSYSTSDKASWKNLVDNETLEPEVQGMMSTWQYEEFHKAGQKLAESGIVSLLKKECNQETTRRVFKSELEAVEASELALNIIRTSTELYKIYLQAKAKSA